MKSENKHPYGELSNVWLTDDEYIKLQQKFPDTHNEKIDDLGFYIGAKGDSYKNHYLTILMWDRRDSKKKTAVIKKSKFNNFEQSPSKFDDVERKSLEKLLEKGKIKKI